MAAVKHQPKRLDFSNFAKGGSRVVAQSADQEKFKVMCKCGEVYVANRAHLRNAKNKGRNLHCEECHCKNMKRVATAAAVGRSRVGGMFAKEHDKFMRENA